VNLVTEVAVVEARAGAYTPQQLAEEVTQAGFPTTPRNVDGEGGSASDLSAWVERKRQEQQQQWRRLAVAIVLLVLSAIGH
jgi:Cu2+-exporting ATPase